jgi:hypothetical protein
MLACKDATVLISADLDRSLRWRERLPLGVQLVLIRCEPCRRFRRQVAFLRAAARQYALRVVGTS